MRRAFRRGRARIQFHQHVAFLNVLAFDDVDFGHHAGGRGGELRAGGGFVRRGGRGLNRAVTGDVTMQRDELERAGLDADDVGTAVSSSDAEAAPCDLMSA